MRRTSRRSAAARSSGFMASSICSAVMLVASRSVQTATDGMSAMPGDDGEPDKRNEVQRSGSAVLAKSKAAQV